MKVIDPNQSNFSFEKISLTRFFQGQNAGGGVGNGDVVIDMHFINTKAITCRQCRTHGQPHQQFHPLRSSLFNQFVSAELSRPFRIAQHALNEFQVKILVDKPGTSTIELMTQSASAYDHHPESTVPTGNSFINSGATFDTRDVGTGKTVTLHGVTLTGSPDGHPNSPTCGHLKLPHPERGVTMG